MQLRRGRGDPTRNRPDIFPAVSGYRYDCVSLEADIKVCATGLGFGILLDATVVRMLLVPALVSLFGEWNWYLPRSVGRLLRVKAPEQGTAVEHAPDLEATAV
jgi:MMPL family